MKNSELIEALSKLPPDLDVRTNDDGAWRALSGWPKVGWVGPSEYSEYDEPTEGASQVILLDAEYDGNLDHIRGLG